MFVPESLSSLV